MDKRKTKEKYPDVLTPAQRRRYNKAMEEINPDMDRICEELRKCSRITADDLNIIVY